MELIANYRLPQKLDLTSTTVWTANTSGSTGLPKVWCISQSMALAFISRKCTAGKDIIMYYATMSTGSLQAREIVQSIFHRSPRIISAQPLTDDLTLDVVQKHDVNLAYMTPFNITSCFKRMLTGNYNLPKLKWILTGGSALSDVTKTNFSSSFPNVEIGLLYGMTEIGPISCSVGSTKPDSLGQLMTGISAKARMIQSKLLLTLIFTS